MKATLSLIVKDLKRVTPAGILVVLYCVITQLVFHRICPLVIITGFPCPACGMTRSFACLCTGRLHEALQYNIMVIPWILLAFSFLLTRYFLPEKIRMTEIFLCLVCLATIAYYVVRILCQFPSEPVMIYHEDNILAALRWRIAGQ